MFYEILRNRKKRIAIVTALMLLATAFVSVQNVSAISAPTATALINAKSGATLRAKASTSSKKVKVLKNNSAVTIKKEVFISKTSTSAKKKWYQVSAAGKTGYVRSDLVDTVKYSSVSGKTTTALNYRVGACEKMKKKGTLSKGAGVTVVLKANLKGNSTVWYKIKIGSKYYYVSSKYVTLVASTPVAQPAPTPVAQPAPAPVVQPAPTLSISTSGLTMPTLMYHGASYCLRGKITSNKTIDKVVVGIVNSAGGWTIQETTAVNGTSFDIATVDNKIKFGTLPVGAYTYRIDVYVGGTAYTKVAHAFQITGGASATLLANTALMLAWPLGTSSTQYAYSGGSATEAYKAALNVAYPNRSSWGAGPKAGASCDVFIGTVCVYSGYDTKMRRGLNQQWADFENTAKWQKVNYSYKESELKNGDIIIYSKTSESNHVCMYVTINGKGYLAEAALDSKYGYINSSISKILKKDDKTKLYVYRAIA